MNETPPSLLVQVLFGSGLLTPAIQTAAISLLAGIVPSEWTKLWDAGPEKPQGAFFIWSLEQEYENYCC
jgi:hypothetical protein